jgi:hypothetical protein
MSLVWLLCGWACGPSLVTVTVTVKSDGTSMQYTVRQTCVAIRLTRVVTSPRACQHPAGACHQPGCVTLQQASAGLKATNHAVFGNSCNRAGQERPEHAANRHQWPPLLGHKAQQ